MDNTPPLSPFTPRTSVQGGPDEIARAQPGTILWLKAAVTAAAFAPDVPALAFNHPCIVIGVRTGLSRGQGFWICMMTSFGRYTNTEHIEVERLAEAIRKKAAVPIHPNQHYNDPPEHCLKMADNRKLRRSSWALTTNVYPVQPGALERYKHNLPTAHFLLEGDSLKWLRQQCGFAPLLSPPLASLQAQPLFDPNEEVPEWQTQRSDSDVPGLLADPSPPVVPQDQSFTTQSKSNERSPLLRSVGSLLPVGQRHYDAVNDIATTYPPTVRTTGVYHDEDQPPSTSMTDLESATTSSRHPRQAQLHAVRKLILAIWRHLPRRQAVGRTLTYLVILGISGAVLGLTGYRAYCVVHKLISAALAVVGAVARG